MKLRFLLIVILFSTVLFFSCDKNNNCVSTPSFQSGICIDSTLVNDSLVCIEIYDPVCGCDDVTYSNSCYADRYGVASLLQENVVIK